VDVSFISVTKILPALRTVLAPEADVVALVKPQFEVGRFQVGRGGLVTDPALHLQALHDAAWSAQRESGYALLGACPSPLTGAEGNHEFFMHLRPGANVMAPARLDEVVKAAVDAARAGA
jgi:23S rRNA (cytidine1920-2'-O)/16S rRNA (cytidine1409-2'-O)-methyltransferase